MQLFGEMDVDRLLNFEVSSVGENIGVGQFLNAVCIAIVEAHWDQRF